MLSLKQNITTINCIMPDVNVTVANINTYNNMNTYNIIFLSNL